MRIARGACWVIVAAALGAVSLVALDAAVRLPGWLRVLGLATWLTGTGVFIWRFVVRPWREERTPDEPTSTAAQDLPGNLSAAAAAALSLVACLLAGTLVPGASEHLRRVAFPWQKPSAVPYRVVVTSGDPGVHRNHPITLTAYIEKLDAAAPTPDSATLVCNWGNRQSSARMTGDGNGAFHAVVSSTASSFDYRVEVGGAVSETLTVTALDPVELALGSATDIRAPKYAPNAPKRTVPGFASFESFQHGTAEFRLRFTRPAADAFIEFRPEGGSLELTRIALSADRLMGTATVRLEQEGNLRLVLVAEENGKKLRTETPASVRLKPDGPPRFTMIAGISPRPVAARPDAVLLIEFAAIDDVALGEAVLEYALDSFDSRSETIPIPLIGVGTPEASGRCEFDLAKLKAAGKPIRFRLRIADTRRSDDGTLKPLEATYPEAGWATIRFDPAAPPLANQEIVGRRDAVKASIDAAKEAVKEATEDIETVQTESEGKPVLAPEHNVRLHRAREVARKAMGLLHDAAREATLNPELRALATQASESAERFLKEADDPLRKAATDLLADRVGSLAISAKHLSDAMDRIEQLLARNDRLARDRLDNLALMSLAVDQAALAEKASTLPADELTRKQQALLGRFQKLLVESEPLRSAADAAQQQEFERLAASASDLAGMLRELNTAAMRLHVDTRVRLLSTFIDEQKALLVRAIALRTRVETAARLAKVSLPALDQVRAIADFLAGGKTLDALREMVVLASALESVAASFEKWASDRSEARTAARHIALWQDDLRNRFRAATGGNAASFDTLAAATKDEFRNEQASIRSAVASLGLPPGNDAKARRETALEHLSLADGFLGAKGANADTAMKAASEALVQLADKLPTIQDRLNRSRADFDKLWRDQELILTGAEGALRNTPDAAALAKKLATLVDWQKKQYAAFAAIDLPGMEARRVRTLAAHAAAVADLRDALPLDILASQRWAKRELDRVKNILADGSIPPDDRAHELARRLNAVGKSMEAFGPNATAMQLQTHAQEMQEILRLTNLLPAMTEAAVVLNDARDAMQSADMGFRNGSKQPEVLRRLTLASSAMGKLSDRLNGAESELDRVRRLAEYRRAGALSAVKQAANPTLAAEIARQLGREMDELTHTRVGSAGQLRKKWLLAEYARLKDNATPERMAGMHAALADSLEELGALMADIDDLTATFDRTPPIAAPSSADSFLPSRLLADALRDLGRDYRRTHEQITHLAEELLRRTKPTDSQPLTALEKKQRELVADVSKLAESLSRHAIIFPADPEQIAADALLVADRLHDGSLPAAKEMGERTAWALRTLATSDKAKPATEIAVRQEAILKQLTALFDSSGVAAAQQNIRADELTRQVADMIQTLEAAARDIAADEATGKALTDAANTAKAAGKLLVEATQKADAGKPEDAAALRGDAESLIRAAGGKAAGAGPATTTLPRLDPDTAVIGAALRRAEQTMRAALRDLGGKTDVPASTKSMQVAAESLSRSAKGVNDRLK